MKLKYRMTLAAASMALSLLVIEGGLRIMGETPTASRYVYDADCGARMVPNYSGIQNDEGCALVTTNAKGFRDRPHSITKPAGVFRIAILGDSFAEAAQVDIEETFWAILESELFADKCFPDKKIEVLNFGVSGYGTAQELHMYRTAAKKYAPDLVLLCFLPGNDVRNNSWEIETENDRPFYRLNDGKLILDNSFRNNTSRQLFQSSRWIRFKHALVSHSRIMRLIYDALQQQGAKKENARTLESGIEDAVFFSPQNEKWLRAWETTDALILQVAKEVKKSGGKFALVTLNNAIQVHPDPDRRLAFAQRWNASDLTWPDKHLAELAKRSNLLHFPLTPRMLTIAQESGMFFHGFSNTALGVGHWNEAGHTVAAKLLASDICQWKHDDDILPALD